jgi:hypothetical protein
MPLLFSPVYSPARLLQLQSFLFRVRVGRCPSPTLQWCVPHFSRCWTPSPSPSKLGEMATHLPSLAGLFIYSLHGRVPLPPSGGAFLMKATITSFPCSKVAGQGPPLLPSLASLFIHSSCEGVPLPYSLELRVPHPFCYVSFFFSCLFIIQFFFLFALGRGQSV